MSNAAENIEAFNSKIKRVIITEDEIKEAIAQAGKKIDAVYDGRPILLVSILKGAFVFMADLCRAVSVPCEIGFMCAKSYYAGTRQNSERYREDAEAEKSAFPEGYHSAGQTGKKSGGFQGGYVPIHHS